MNSVPTVTTQRRIFHEIGALELGNGMIPRDASVYIDVTEHVASYRKNFNSGLREYLLSRIALRLEEKKYSHAISFPAEFDSN